MLSNTLTFTILSYGYLIEDSLLKKVDTVFFSSEGFALKSKKDQIKVQDNNVIQLITYDSELMETDTITYSYYLDKLNTIGNEMHGLTFLGKDCKSLIKSEVHSSNGKKTITYIYSFDNKGRVSKRDKSTTIKGENSATTEYSFGAVYKYTGLR